MFDFPHFHIRRNSVFRNFGPSDLVGDVTGGFGLRYSNGAAGSFDRMFLEGEVVCLKVVGPAFSGSAERYEILDPWRWGNLLERSRRPQARRGQSLLLTISDESELGLVERTAVSCP